MPHLARRVAVLALAVTTQLRGQEGARPLAPDDLEPHTHRFTLTDGSLAGPGADLLRREVAACHALLLGEYHGSQRLGELVAALLPILHECGYRHLGLEVGPTSAELLTELLGDGSAARSTLAAWHARWRIADRNRTYEAIPFCGAEVDAAFLATAGRLGFRLHGIDQEFAFGLVPVFDRLVERLPAADRTDGAERLAAARCELLSARDRFLATGERIAVTLHAAAHLPTALALATRAGGAPARIADDIAETLAIYRANADGDWWQANTRRIAHMKHNLGRSLQAAGFRFPEHRIVVKVGAVHSGRGLSLLRQFEVGNTLHELAGLAGVRSLHVCLADRWWLSPEGPVDRLEQDRRYEVVRKLGDRERWTVVDLRPVRVHVLYERLQVERFVGEWFEQHDLVLIPPADEDPVPLLPPSTPEGPDRGRAK